MKRLNLLVMSLVSAAALSFTSCSSNDDLAGNAGQDKVDGVYMTLKVVGSTTTRTTGDKKENGTEAESSISNGTLYIYDGATCVFRRDLGSDAWTTKPTQAQAGVTKPIKVSVNAVTTGKKYNVYFLANKTGITDPLQNDLTFDTQNKGGEEYATENNFVMFNENDKNVKANSSTVEFTDDNKSETNPATASEIKLDRVVARIDEPTVDAKVTAITTTKDTKTVNVKDVIKSIKYQTYAVSNLNNNSYVKQNWDADGNNLLVKFTDKNKFYKAYDEFGTPYEAKGLNLFGNVKNNYAFENTTTNAKEATAIYFNIKAELTDEAKKDADFADGTFYRYDGHLFTSIQQIFDAAAKGEIANPFTESNAKPAADIVNEIKGEDGKLIAESEKLAKFREDNHIEVYREGVMYYRWAIADQYYKTSEAYSVLRNSIYKLNVTQISEVGKDVPNGPDNPNTPNYYMTVTVTVNPWILNSKDIDLK